MASHLWQYRFFAETFVTEQVIAKFEICFYQTDTSLHFSQSTLIIAPSTYLQIGIETSRRKKYTILINHLVKVKKGQHL